MGLFDAFVAGIAYGYYNANNDSDEDDDWFSNRLKGDVYNEKIPFKGHLWKCLRF